MNTAADIAELAAGKHILAVTGAGMSTDSGLPDYRGTGSTPKTPVDVAMFASDPVWYRWLWYRNESTWRILEALEPNPGHRALAKLERAGMMMGVATQNVDRLDARAGVKRLWELHGRYDTVVCLRCGHTTPRVELSERLLALNPGLPLETDPRNVDITPEADRAAAEACDFTPAYCQECDGPLKPGIVMFGEGLPDNAFGPALEAASRCDLVLVAGTSLAVSTGLWVVHEALSGGAGLVIINRGRTAVDHVADVRLDESTSQALPRIVDLLTGD